MTNSVKHSIKEDFANRIKNCYFFAKFVTKCSNARLMSNIALTRVETIDISKKSMSTNYMFCSHISQIAHIAGYNKKSKEIGVATRGLSSMQ